MSTFDMKVRPCSSCYDISITLLLEHNQNSGDATPHENIDVNMRACANVTVFYKSNSISLTSFIASMAPPPISPSIMNDGLDSNPPSSCDSDLSNTKTGPRTLPIPRIEIGASRGNLIHVSSFYQKHPDLWVIQPDEVHGQILQALRYCTEHRNRLNYSLQVFIGTVLLGLEKSLENPQGHETVTYLRELQADQDTSGNLSPPAASIQVTLREPQYISPAAMLQKDIHSPSNAVPSAIPASTPKLPGNNQSSLPCPSPVNNSFHSHPHFGEAPRLNMFPQTSTGHFESGPGGHHSGGIIQRSPDEGPEPLEMISSQTPYINRQQFGHGSHHSLQHGYREQQSHSPVISVPHGGLDTSGSSLTGDDVRARQLSAFRHRQLIEQQGMMQQGIQPPLSSQSNGSHMPNEAINYQFMKSGYVPHVQSRSSAIQQPNYNQASGPVTLAPSAMVFPQHNRFMASSARKRHAPEDDNTQASSHMRPTKKVKANPDLSGDSYMLNLHQTQTLSNLTIKQLKEWATTKQIHIKSSDRKPAIIQKVQQWLTVFATNSQIEPQATVPPGFPSQSGQIPENQTPSQPYLPQETIRQGVPLHSGQIWRNQTPTHSPLPKYVTSRGVTAQYGQIWQIQTAPQLPASHGMIPQGLSLHNGQIREDRAAAKPPIPYGSSLHQPIELDTPSPAQGQTNGIYAELAQPFQGLKEKDQTSGLAETEINTRTEQDTNHSSPVQAHLEASVDGDFQSSDLIHATEQEIDHSKPAQAIKKASFEEESQSSNTLQASQHASDDLYKIEGGNCRVDGIPNEMKSEKRKRVDMEDARESKSPDSDRSKKLKASESAGDEHAPHLADSESFHIAGPPAVSTLSPLSRESVILNMYDTLGEIEDHLFAPRRFNHKYMDKAYIKSRLTLFRVPGELPEPDQEELKHNAERSDGPDLNRSLDPITSRILSDVSYNSLQSNGSSSTNFEVCQWLL
jgi:hypothetical protein